MILLFGSEDSTSPQAARDALRTAGATLYASAVRKHDHRREFDPKLRTLPYPDTTLGVIAELAVATGGAAAAGDLTGVWPYPAAP